MLELLKMIKKDQEDLVTLNMKTQNKLNKLWLLMDQNQMEEN